MQRLDDKAALPAGIAFTVVRTSDFSGCWLLAGELLFLLLPALPTGIAFTVVRTSDFVVAGCWLVSNFFCFCPLSLRESLYGGTGQ